MSDTVVDTTNYFSVALHDDEQYASGSSTPATPAGPEVETKEDRAGRKARRIAEAVERSKKEYTADNVYTERGVGICTSVVDLDMEMGTNGFSGS